MPGKGYVHFDDIRNVAPLLVFFTLHVIINIDSAVDAEISVLLYLIETF